MQIIRFILLCNYTIFSYLSAVLLFRLNLNKLGRQLTASSSRSLLGIFNVKIDKEQFSPAKFHHKSSKNSGPTIYIANHNSSIDVFILAGYIQLPSISFGSRRIPIPFIDFVHKKCGHILIKPGKNDKLNSFKEALALLQNKQSIFIFPSGARIKSIRDRVLPGAYVMAKKTQAKIVPVYINYGPEKSFTALQKSNESAKALIQTRILKEKIYADISFGEPLDPFDFNDKEECNNHIKTNYKLKLNSYQL